MHILGLILNHLTAVSLKENGCMRFFWVLKESCSWGGQLYYANSPMRYAKSQFSILLVS